MVPDQVRYSTNMRVVFTHPDDDTVDAAHACIDGVDILLVRPYPAQTFTGAVQRVKAVLPGISEADARRLLRPHFPEVDEFDARYAPHLAAGEDDGARAVRTTVAHKERLHRIVYTALAVSVAVIAGAAAQNHLDPPPAAPLDRPETLAVVEAFGVACDGDGWAAACFGELTGGFTLRGYLTEDGVMLSARAGTQATTMIFTADQGSAAETFTRLTAGGSSDGERNVVHLAPGPGTPPQQIVMWGTPPFVDGLAAKAERLGWTTVGAAPTLGAAPTGAKQVVG